MVNTRRKGRNASKQSDVLKQESAPEANVTLTPDNDPAPAPNKQSVPETDPDVHPAPEQPPDPKQDLDVPPAPIGSEFLLQHMQVMHKEEKLVDLILKCGDDEYSAHKLVISAYSTVLRNVLLNEALSLAQIANPLILSIDQLGLDPPVLASIIQFMYSGCKDPGLMGLSDLENAAKVLGVHVEQQVLEKAKLNDLINIGDKSEVKHSYKVEDDEVMEDIDALCTDAFSDNSDVKAESSEHDDIEVAHQYKPSREKKKSYYDKVPKFSCDLCERKFLKIETLEKHRKDHDGLVPCPVCGKFIQKRTQKLHMAIHKKTFAHKCPVCKKGFHQASALQAHMHHHTGKKPYQCKVCGQGYVSAQGLKKHEERGHENGDQYKFTCDICSTGFLNSEELEVHTHIAHKLIQRYRCSVCRDVFEDKVACHEHLKSCNTWNLEGEKDSSKMKVSIREFDRDAEASEEHGNGEHRVEFVFCCFHCDRTYMAKRSLQEHLQNVLLGYEECKVCGKQVAPSNKAKHMSSHEGLKYYCETCGKGFARPGYLRDHQGKHHQDGDKKVYNCKLCDKSYNIKGSFYNHIRMDHASTPLLCCLCGETLRHKGLMRRHMQLHDNFQYACPECGKVFTTKESCNRHLSTHTERERTHKCQFCDKSYLSKAHLQFHLKTHETTRPYPCQFCEKSFLTSTRLREHTDWHLGNKPHTCQLCSKAFTMKKNLVSHLKTHTITVHTTTDQAVHYMTH